MSKSTKANQNRSQKSKVLSHLKSGRNLSQLAAFGLYGCFRLASRVNDLRNEGYKIKTINATDINGKTYALYRLEDQPVNPGIQGIY